VIHIAGGVDPNPAGLGRMDNDNWGDIAYGQGREHLPVS
jgi:hypothetical protein